ncbi:hypothetical protein [Kocuria arenosa]|uniref:hypothetical protein n=1 Tax=Kocuria arenosa TaxID=3071446 RepID=UPI0034D6FFBD
MPRPSEYDDAAALAAGHAPDSLAVHAAQLGLCTLEKPMTIAEAADEDGFLTAVVELSPFALMEGRVNEEAGEDCPIARAMVQEGRGQGVWPDRRRPVTHGGFMTLLPRESDRSRAPCRYLGRSPRPGVPQPSWPALLPGRHS